MFELCWIVFLLAAFYYFWQRRQLLVEAQSWLKVKGQITEFKLVKATYTLWPEVEYRYQVLEQVLIGHYLFLDTIHNNPNSKYSRNVAYQIAVAYKNESEVDVYYNPNKPEESALNVAIPKSLNIILVLLAGFFTIHAIALLYQLIPLF
jgi:hypothetical protein